MTFRVAMFTIAGMAACAVTVVSVVDSVEGPYPPLFSFAAILSSTCVWFLFARSRFVLQPVLVCLPSSVRCLVYKRIISAASVAEFNRRTDLHAQSPSMKSARPLGAVAAVVASTEPWRRKSSKDYDGGWDGASGVSRCAGDSGWCKKARSTSNAVKCRDHLTSVDARKKKTAAAAVISTSSVEEAFAAQRLILECRNRSVGFLHACIASAGAFFCVFFDSRLAENRMLNYSPFYTVLGVISAGYFFWDVCTILSHFGGKRSIMWLLHGVISLLGACSPFLLPSSSPMCFYAAALLLLEASTPALALHFYARLASEAEAGSFGDEKCRSEVQAETLRSGARDSEPSVAAVPTAAASESPSVLPAAPMSTDEQQEPAAEAAALSRFYFRQFKAVFFVCRLIYAPFILFPSIWYELTWGVEAHHISETRKYIYYTAMPTFALLNFQWAAGAVLHRSKR